MTIKVLHYLPNLDLGGTAKTCQLFFEHASKDFEVAVAYPANCDLIRMDEFEKAAKVSDGRLFSLDGVRSIQDVIDDNNIDILHVYRSGYKEFPEPGDDVNVPHFVETNVFGFLDPNPKVSKTLYMSKWLMEDSFKRMNMRCFAWGQNRFDYVNNPVEMPYTDNKMKGLDTDAIWLGRCGRPDNGIYNSVNVDAARLLRLQGYDVRFLVVAPPSNMVDDLIAYEIPFKMIEPTTDPLVLSQFYNSLNIYAHARADGETFGVNIAEAMIHGIPVVTHIATPSVPGMGVFQSQTELVDDGDTGLIVNNDPVEYSEALKKIIDNPGMTSRMCFNSIAKALREYHVDVCMEKLENIYREVVNL
jgi:hypothetical protein